MYKIIELGRYNYLLIITLMGFPPKEYELIQTTIHIDEECPRTRFEELVLHELDVRLKQLNEKNISILVVFKLGAARIHSVQREI